MKQSLHPERAARQVFRMTARRPALGLVLGSGFQAALADLQVEAEIGYDQLPGFPPVGVSGHAGKLLVGMLGGTPVVVLSGRSHYYEGHSLAAVTFGVRVLAALGVRDLVLTNAAGGINRKFRPGDFMGLRDHINFLGENPLRGPEWPGCPRFIDLTEAYDPGLRRMLARAARAAGARWHTGVYLAVPGPSYETPAEIRAFARWGADAVGMSTVPEAIAARHCGLRVAGVSCITNPAAGRGRGGLSHAEVLATAERVRLQAGGLLTHFAEAYGRATGAAAGR